MQLTSVLWMRTGQGGVGQGGYEQGQTGTGRDVGTGIAHTRLVLDLQFQHDHVEGLKSAVWVLLIRASMLHDPLWHKAASLIRAAHPYRYP